MCCCALFIQGPYYFLRIANFFDIMLIMGHGIIFYLHSAKVAATRQLDFEDDERRIDLRHVTVKPDRLLYHMGHSVDAKAP